MKKVVPKVKRILNMSLKQAKLYDDWEVKIEHIMISLINDYNNNAIKILEDMGIDIDMLHKKIEKSLIKNKKEDDMYDIHDDTIPLNTTSQNIIKGAEKECDLLWCNARLVAVNFYKSLGFKINGELFDIVGIGPHYYMYKEI